MSILSTERLELRRPHHDDAEFFLELLNDPSFIENIADRGVRTKEDAVNYINNLLSHIHQHGYGYFVVTDKSQRPLGICGVLNRDTLPVPDIGFAFLPRYCGKGYAYEASHALMQKGLTDWKIRRLCAIVSPHNKRSIGLVKKLGLRYEKNLSLSPNNEVEFFIYDGMCDVESRNRYQALLRQTAIAIQIFNKEGKCVEANDAWESLFCASRKDLLNYNLFEDPQHHNTGVIQFFQRAFAGEQVRVPANYYDPALSGNPGRARWLESTFTPIMNEKGEIVEVAILFSDITDLKNTENELARSRDEMKAIFENMPESIMVQDMNFNILYANTLAVKAAGFNSLDEWLSKKAQRDIYDHLREDGSPMPEEEFPSRRALRGDHSEVIMRFRNKLSGEEKISQGVSRVIHDENGKPASIISVHRDITEKKRIERQLQAAMESRNLFFSVASHELRTPITALKLNAQLMNLTYPKISPETLTKLNRQLTKLSKLVDEMLDISRLSRGHLEVNPREVNLSELARDVLSGFSDQLNLAEIPLTLDIDEEVTGNWDPDRLEQVIENLVTNAIRYARKSPLMVRVKEQGDKVILEVRDQGPGIPAEDHEKIFNRFERSRSFGERSGMGLGLYIVKEIVSLHGGTISVANVDTGGASFVVELPRSIPR